MTFSQFGLPCSIFCKERTSYTYVHTFFKRDDNCLSNSNKYDKTTKCKQINNITNIIYTIFFFFFKMFHGKKLEFFRDKYAACWKKLYALRDFLAFCCYKKFTIVYNVYLLFYVINT